MKQEKQFNEKKRWLGMVSPILVTDWSLLLLDSFVVKQVYVGGYVRRRIFTTKENTRWEKYYKF